jgi:HlyD family secretion protein
MGDRSGQICRSAALGMRQNEQVALRIVLRQHDHVLEVERGSFLGPRSRYVYLLHGDEIIRVPVELRSASISNVEVLRGLSAGDQIVISDPSGFGDANQMTVIR